MAGREARIDLLLRLAERGPCTVFELGVPYTPRLTPQMHSWKAKGWVVQVGSEKAHTPNGMGRPRTIWEWVWIPPLNIHDRMVTTVGADGALRDKVQVHRTQMERRRAKREAEQAERRLALEQGRPEPIRRGRQPRKPKRTMVDPRPFLEWWDEYLAVTGRSESQTIVAARRSPQTVLSWRNGSMADLDAIDALIVHVGETDVLNWLYPLDEEALAS